LAQLKAVLPGLARLSRIVAFKAEPLEPPLAHLWGRLFLRLCGVEVLFGDG
jgi:hypothetical protein